HRPASHGSANSIPRSIYTKRRALATPATTASRPAAPRYWSAEMMDTVERLARLRGIGDAYHDYRGELKYVTLETKISLLRAMGCAVDEPAALALELGRLETDSRLRFLPPIAAAHGSRIGIDINATAQEFGSTLVWSVCLE